MDEEKKNEYIDKINREVERKPSFNENKILQALEEQLRELYKSDPALADDISELLLQIQSGEVADTAAAAARHADAAARRADAAAVEKYYEGTAWEKKNLGRQHGGGKRRKTKKRRSKKRRSKKRRSKKRRTSTRRTRRR
jgi:hypothetical protein